MNGKEPPRKKKRKTSPVTEPSSSISSLPYDLLLNCLARVSRSYYPTLSLVSKNFRSIVASPELYKTRSLLNCTESCFYLCLHKKPKRTLTKKASVNLFVHIPSSRKPKQTLTKKSSVNLFVHIPSTHITPGSRLVAVGSNIYKIGGCSTSPSSRVSVLDCRSHTWHQAPSMRVKRFNSCRASLVNRKIYVTGGCEDVNSLNWIEVFDLKTQTWDSVTNPRRKIRHQEERGLMKSLGLDGKLYLFGDDKSVVYDPIEGRWNPTGMDRDIATTVFNLNCAVIDNVLFYWSDREGVLKWYDHKVSLWKKLKGVTRFPVLQYHYIKMVDLGGKMAVLWDGFGYKKNMLWCAVIALERQDGDEICGKVEWLDGVLALNRSYRLWESDALCINV